MKRLRGPGVRVILFKYLRPDRLDVLERNLIRYTPPGEFNDPFESSPHSESFATGEEIDRVSETVLREQRDHMWAELPDEIKAKLGRPAYDRIVDGIGPVASSMFSDISKGLVPIFREQIKTSVDDKLGILSLSERPDSLLMWAHYAAAHPGFLIGIDPTHSSFSSSRASNESNARKVSYSKERPSKPLMDLSPEEFFFTKSLEWSYEEEWRILARLADAVEVKPVQPGPIHVFPLSADCVRVVICGCRATREFRDRVVAVCAEERYRGVKLLAAHVDDRHFALNFVKVGK
jgi:hypothetical protein